MSDTLIVLAWVLFFAGALCLLFGFLGLLESLFEFLGIIPTDDDDGLG